MATRALASGLGVPSELGTVVAGSPEPAVVVPAPGSVVVPAPGSVVVVVGLIGGVVVVVELGAPSLAVVVAHVVGAVVVARTRLGSEVARAGGVVVAVVVVTGPAVVVVAGRAVVVTAAAVGVGAAVVAGAVVLDGGSAATGAVGVNVPAVVEGTLTGVAERPSGATRRLGVASVATVVVVGAAVVVTGCSVDARRAFSSAAWAAAWRCSACLTATARAPFTAASWAFSRACSAAAARWSLTSWRPAASEAARRRCSSARTLLRFSPAERYWSIAEVCERATASAYALTRYGFRPVPKLAGSASPSV